MGIVANNSKLEVWNYYEEIEVGELKRKERLLFKKTVARRLKKRVLEKKRLKNNARSKSSKHWLKRLDIYINLDRELLNSLKVK